MVEPLSIQWPSTANGTSRHSNPPIRQLVSPWIPTTAPAELKVLGKLGEETGELTSATNRAIIQGINESQPVTGKPNRKWLEEELADVRATSRLTISEFGLDEDFIEQRAQQKEAQLRLWLQM
jgi:NTP pyrophosphatase (non-canonical NTP hydrolase)